MGTIEIHEPEVKEVKPPSRPRAAVLRRPLRGVRSSRSSGCGTLRSKEG